MRRRTPRHGRRSARTFASSLAALLCTAPALAGPAETRVAPGLSALAAPVGCGDFAAISAWSTHHGYRFPAGEGGCLRGAGPAVAVGWTTAAVFANAASERAGLVPAYRSAAGAVARGAGAPEPAPTLVPGATGYRLPSLGELGLPPLRARMTRLQEWTGTPVDLGDGRAYFYLCRPGACDFHSPGTSGRGVGFRLVRSVAP